MRAQFGRMLYVCLYVYEDSNFGGFRIPYVYVYAHKWLALNCGSFKVWKEYAAFWINILCNLFTIHFA